MNKVIAKTLLAVSAVCFASNLHAQRDDLTTLQIINTADNGVPSFQAEAAYRLMNGLGATKNLQKAKDYANKAADAGDGLGYWILFQIARQEKSDPTLYPYYLEKAADLDYPLAIKALARMYDTGYQPYGIQKDEAKALTLYEKAAELEDYDAMAVIGHHLRANYSSYPHKREKIIPYLEKAAANGNIAAMNQLANIYYHGNIVRKNFDKTFELYHKAAEAGSFSGVEGLADCYRLGIGTAINHAQAFRLYSSLEENNGKALFLRGYYLYNGAEGVNKDETNGRYYLNKALDQSYVFAQAFLGSLYFTDHGWDKAFTLCRSAFDNEDFDELTPSLEEKVYRQLYGMYRNSRGTSQDRQLAEDFKGKADNVKKSEPEPFGYVPMMSEKRSLEKFGLSSLSSPESFLDQITFDYPQNPESDNYSTSTFPVVPPVTETPNTSREVTSGLRVSGIVTDAQGTPIPGASVIVKGTTNGTVTSADGSYLLTGVSPDATLIASSRNHFEESVQIRGHSTINFGLQSIRSAGSQTSRGHASSTGTGRSRFAMLIEVLPYGFSPISAPFEENTWFKDFSSGASVSGGFLTRDGLFIGLNANAQIIHKKKYTVIGGGLDLRYHFNVSSSVRPYIGINPGVVYETKTLGTGMQLGASAGSLILIQRDLALTVGIKGWYDAFFKSEGENTKYVGVGPSIGLLF